MDIVRWLPPAKAFDSIFLNLEPDSNVTVDRLWHSSKHSAQRASTLDGMVMDDNELHFWKAPDSILTNSEPAPNVTVDRLKHAFEFYSPAISLAFFWVSLQKFRFHS
jgi:hypothetical protein